MKEEEEVYIFFHFYSTYSTKGGAIAAEWNKKTSFWRRGETSSAWMHENCGLQPYREGNNFYYTLPATHFAICVYLELRDSGYCSKETVNARFAAYIAR